MGRGKKSADGPGFFDDESGQMEMFDKSLEQRIIEDEKVECLGMTLDRKSLPCIASRIILSGKANRK